MGIDTGEGGQNQERCYPHSPGAIFEGILVSPESLLGTKQLQACPSHRARPGQKHIKYPNKSILNKYLRTHAVAMRISL